MTPFIASRVLPKGTVRLRIWLCRLRSLASVSIACCAWCSGNQTELTSPASSVRSASKVGINHGPVLYGLSLPSPLAAAPPRG
jgi:hypothetical protein